MTLNCLSLRTWQHSDRHSFISPPLPPPLCTRLYRTFCLPPFTMSEHFYSCLRPVAPFVSWCPSHFSYSKLLLLQLLHVSAASSAFPSCQDQQEQEEEQQAILTSHWKSCPDSLSSTSPTYFFMNPLHSGTCPCTKLKPICQGHQWLLSLSELVASSSLASKIFWHNETILKLLQLESGPQSLLIFPSISLYTCSQSLLWYHPHSSDLCTCHITLNYL